MTIQAVFWDYDNTILATAEAHWQKHQTVLASQGIELAEHHRKKIYENNGHQNWEWLQKELGLKAAKDEYLEAIDCEFITLLTQLEFRPGVVELFELFSNLKIPQAIITNARRNSAQPVLEQKKITPYMQFILFKEDYEGRKPDPEPYLAGFKKMGHSLGQAIEPKRCLAIEDDPKGVESAHKAGAIVIQRKIDEEEPDSPFADFCCFHKEDLIRIVTNLCRDKFI